MGRESTAQSRLFLSNVADLLAADATDRASDAAIATRVTHTDTF